MFTWKKKLKYFLYIVFWGENVSLKKIIIKIGNFLKAIMKKKEKTPEQ